MLRKRAATEVAKGVELENRLLLRTAFGDASLKARSLWVDIPP